MYSCKQIRFSLCFADIDWLTIRSQKAPQLAEKEEGTEVQQEEDFDWELSSIAAALPVRYEHSTPDSL